MSVLPLAPPSSEHWFGTDELGRDQLSRVIAAVRVSIVVPFLSVGIALVIGGCFGIVAGYVRGAADTLTMRGMDVLFAFPELILAIIVIAALGPSVLTAVIAIAIVYIPRFARVARVSTLTVEGSAYIEAARIASLSGPRIVTRHVIPNIRAPLIVMTALSMSTAQLAYATLSFLGFGARPPQADFGSMLSASRNFMTFDAWLVICPGTQPRLSHRGLQPLRRLHSRCPRSTFRKGDLVTRATHSPARASDAPDWAKGLRIVVTGAAGTLGKAIVDEGVRQGAAVIATGRDPAISAAVLPMAARRVVADLSRPAECKALIEQSRAELGGIDVLINNAAVLTHRRIVDLDPGDLEHSWAVNVRAPVLLTQAAIPALTESPSPVVINIVSGAGITGGVAPVSAYAMSKAALIVFTKAAAREFGPLGIRVVAVSPPTLESQMQGALDDESRRVVRSMNVLGRPFEATEAASLVLFMASPHASVMTGATIDATGALF